MNKFHSADDMTLVAKLTEYERTARLSESPHEEDNICGHTHNGRGSMPATSCPALVAYHHWDHWGRHGYGNLDNWHIYLGALDAAMATQEEIISIECMCHALSGWAT